MIDEDDVRLASAQWREFISWLSRRFAEKSTAELIRIEAGGFDIKELYREWCKERPS